MKKYLAAWAALDWLTHNRFRKIIAIFKNLENAWEHINKTDLEKLRENEKNIELFFQEKNKIIPEQEIEKLKKNKINLLFIQEKGYPSLLKEIYHPPVFLYYQGSIEYLNLAFAIVGTRKPSAYGKKISIDFTTKLSEYFTIVSGLALGVDTIVHNTCTKIKNPTIAVIGNGLDVIYPWQNKSLITEIKNTGGAIVSEFPLTTPPHHYNFPRRNRIISGLSMGTLIIEGKEASGSLITAKTALEQNREVFAIPGNIYSYESQGPNYLIKNNQAKLVSSITDILEELSFENQIQYNQARHQLSFLSEEEEHIFAALDNTGLDFSQIAHKTNLSIPKISSTLTVMEMKGLAANIGSGIWVKNNK